MVDGVFYYGIKCTGIVLKAFSETILRIAEVEIAGMDKVHGYSKGIEWLKKVGRAE